MEDDLQDDWAEFRPRSPIQPAGQPGNILSGLDVAAVKAEADLREEAARYASKGSGGLSLPQLIAVGVRQFLRHFTEELRCRDTASLIEIIMSDSRMTPDELKGFIRALPESLVQRIVTNGATLASVRGIHGLLAIELDHRSRSRSTDYLLRKVGSTLEVTLYPPHLNGRSVTFTLDESFELGSSKPKDESQDATG